MHIIILVVCIATNRNILSVAGLQQHRIKEVGDARDKLFSHAAHFEFYCPVALQQAKLESREGCLQLGTILHMQSNYKVRAFNFDGATFFFFRISILIVLNIYDDIDIFT